MNLIRPGLPLFLLSAAPLTSVSVTAGDIDFVPVVDVTASYYQTDFDTGEDRENRALVSKPSLLTSYKSLGLDAALSVNHTSVMQAKDSDELDKSYTDFRFASRAGFWEQRLQLNLVSNTSHIATNRVDAIAIDPILSSSDLVKARYQNASLSFTPKRASYIGVDWNLNYGNVKTERTEENANRNLENESYSGLGRLYSGNEFQRVNWDITSQYAVTERRQNQDLHSRQTNGRLGIGLVDKLYVIFVGSEDANQIEQSGISSNSISSVSYGTGLEWRRSSNRYIGVTYNRLDREDEKQEFVGLDANWAFSSNTSIQANYSKKFFGDSYNFSLSHNTRAWRARIGYTDGLTSFTRLQLANQDIGVFVCPLGSPTIDQCFQPDSPNYQLGVDEQFFGFSNVDVDISEEIVLNKAGFASLGYEKNKVSLSLTYRQSTQDYIESDRNRESDSIQFSGTYKIGPRTNFNYQTSYSDILDVNTGRKSSAWNTSVSLSREVSQKTDLTLTLRSLDNESEIGTRAYEDTRLSLSIKYKI
ncbi:TIGR03016 family PEP-CTERM system-associated outer membrane protein [Aliiglaciecola sp. CAU 1673]|uniref:TIGR03016 family PEP-CTERM system-associated outer membrane protein n=1 Tax=Aliiglaciecola sp. CAU 1673 TaxID=3032595 RepID=UPI0023DB57D7|nr:TIGR03016 family PEP-CTERM system-associated outer membrane protein [Aliiglaciecola sp. CAU 1673]MDF2180035.1 TIGR03016 family PEP-CTERM system-associated outer membrane protein [Aliiglaciecola sp. CAU 1673]